MDSYIVLYRGDDTDFTGNQEIVITLDTSLSLDGMAAHFKFLDFSQDFSTIPTDKKLHIVIPSASTSKFPVGSMDAQLWLTDSSGKKRTIANRIHVVVTQSVKDAYDNDDTQAITVVISGGVKILTQADEFDMLGTDWEFRKSVAKLWAALNGKVVNND